MARVFVPNDHIVLASSALPNSSTISYCAQVYYVTAGAGIKTVIQIDGTSDIKQVYLRIGGAATDKPEFGYFDGSTDHRAVGASTLTTNVWISLVGTYDGATYKLYTNGTVASTVDAASPSNFTEVSATIATNPQLNRFWPGRLADVACWNVTLSASEVLALANGARPYQIREHALVGYWPLDGIQSPEPDLSGSANSATLTGTSSAFGPPVMMFTPRWMQTDTFISAPSMVFSQQIITIPLLMTVPISVTLHNP